MVSMSAVTDRVHSVREREDHMRRRVRTARQQLAARLDIGLPEERAMWEAEAARLGDRAHRVRHRFETQVREQMSGMMDDEAGAMSGDYGGDGDVDDGQTGMTGGGGGGGARGRRLVRLSGTDLLEAGGSLGTSTRPTLNPLLLLLLLTYA